MFVATKGVVDLSRNHVRFVNLLHNPDEPVQAMTLTHKLLAMDESLVPLESTAIDVGGMNWGSVVVVPQRILTDGPWSYAAFAKSELVLAAERLRSAEPGPFTAISIVKLGILADLGPYHMQVKNPTQGLFNIVASEEPLRSGIPALWHHKATKNTTLEARRNALLERRADKDRLAQDRMLAEQGRLHLACDLGMAPQRVAAVLTATPMLGVRSWITLSMRNPAPGKEEAMCLWLNSTPGLLLRLIHGNRPYLGRSALTHELARTLPVLDVGKLSAQQLAAAVSIYEELKAKPLQGFSAIDRDQVRYELNARFCSEILGIETAAVQELTQKLGQEPTMHARH